MFQDETLTLSSCGVKIAFKKWHSGKEPVIALHGWLDNSASFDLVAPHIDPMFSFYSLDLTGHGHSDHLPLSADYTTACAVEHVLEFAKEMNFEKFHLVGHSMGAGIASLVAAVAPHQIRTLSLIEGLGPLSIPEEELPKRLLHHFKIKFRKLLTEKPTYSSKEEAAQDRTKKSRLPLEASRILAERGLEKTKSGSFTWRTDSRLIAPTAHPLTERNVRVFLKAIEAPTLFILGSQSELNDYEFLNPRLELMENCETVTLEGGHHIHMEKGEEIGKKLSYHFKKN